MRYHVLTTDYDGTLAENDYVSANAVAALRNVKATGRKLILVTGRELEQLKTVFPGHILFDMIVAENGAMLYRPATKETILLADAPPENLLAGLRRRGVPFSAGSVIVSTWQPHQSSVLEAIMEAGLEYQVIFNKGAVMVLPPGINKATGLHHALLLMELCEHNIVAIGDAENDNAMLQVAECSVAVNNGLPQVRAITDWTTSAPAGNGVIELSTELITTDLQSRDQRLTRHYLELGREADDTSFYISPYGSRILVAGTSSCGKTTFSAAFLEKLHAKHYQYCLIDPEGDYLDICGAVIVGDSSQGPPIDQVMQLLSQVTENVVVCMLAIPYADRPGYCSHLLREINALREATGRPHFVVMDEAHHLLPADYTAEFYHLPEDFNNFMVITTQPGLLSGDLLKKVNIAMTMGAEAAIGMKSFGTNTGQTIELPERVDYTKREILVWQKGIPGTRMIKGAVPLKLLMRHKRKYAMGDMGYNSFYFTGTGHQLNLRANNLVMFVQMADGIDDDTWMFHLRRHDYSRWFRGSVKNEELARNTERIEDSSHDPRFSRKAIFRLIQEQYTTPA